MFKVMDLSTGYGGAPVIRSVSFALERGSSLIFVGKNGCGKTTLMRALIGFLPYSGRIELDDLEMRQIPRGLYARRVAMLSQLSPLYLPYTVFETALMGRYAYKKGFMAGFSKEDQEITGSCLAEVGLYEQRAQLANRLSGGQLQRLFLARALCQTPDILLLDEPTNHLDLKQQLSLIELLSGWRDRGGIICGAMHDLNLTLHFGGQVLLLDAGLVKLRGEAAQVMLSREINECFGVDVVDFMRKSLSSWRQ